MDEKSHHDAFFEDQAARILAGPLFQLAQHRVCEVLERHAALDRSSRVLSLGCGDGSLEVLMARRVGEVTGVDMSPVAVQRARAQAQEHGFSNLSFHESDARRLHMPANTFDSVWAVGFLHHIDDEAIAALLASSFCWLRPGGTLVSMDPSVRRLVGVFQGLFARQVRRYRSPDERELDPRWLAALFGKVGFDDLRTVFYDFFLSPLAWVIPGLPWSLAGVAGRLDAVLLAVPMLRERGSSFAIVGRKPR